MQFPQNLVLLLLHLLRSVMQDMKSVVLLLFLELFVLFLLGCVHVRVSVCVCA